MRDERYGTGNVRRGGGCRSLPPACSGLSQPAGLVKAPVRRAAPDTLPAGGAQGAAVSAALSGLLLWEGPYLVDAAFLAFFALSALAAASAGPDTGWAGPRVVMVAFAALFGGLQVPVLSGPDPQIRPLRGLLLRPPGPSVAGAQRKEPFSSFPAEDSKRSFPLPRLWVALRIRNLS